MRKICFSFLSLIVFLVNSGFAYTSQTQKFITAFETRMLEMNNKEQHNYLDIISSILNDAQLKNNKKLTVFRTEMLNWIATKKAKENIPKKIKTSSSENHFPITTIDDEKIRENRLTMHNKVRREKGLMDLSYHSELERSAVIWAKTLAKQQYRTHKRKENDGFYNYNSIKEWFEELGIHFDFLKGTKSAFSESVAYRAYSCSLTDCNSKLLDISSDIFQTFLREGEGGSHYKAMIMPHYSQIGVGFYLDEAKNVLYVVLHYGTNLLEH